MYFPDHIIRIVQYAPGTEQHGIVFTIDSMLNNEVL